MAARRVILFVLKIGVSAGLLWFVIARVDFGGITARLRGVDWRWLVPGLFVGPAAILLSAWRWHKLSLGLIGYGAAVRYTWIGLFFGSITPGLVGGDLAKGLSLAAKDVRARDSRLPVSIIADKLVGFWVLLLAFVFVALLLLVTQPQLLAGARGVVWIAGALATTGLLGSALLCHPRGTAWFARVMPPVLFAPLRRFAEKFVAAVGTYSGRGRLLAQAAAMSLVLHALNALALWFALRSLAIPASLWFAAAFYPLLSVLLALPISVSGVGVRDVFAASMFAAFGLGAASGVAFSWLLLGLSVPNVLVGGAVQCWEIFSRRAGSTAD
jgi:uncharacterized protein (TIRG00374 family)